MNLPPGTKHFPAQPDKEYKGDDGFKNEIIIYGSDE